MNLLSRCLALDLGERRIGVAVSDASNLLASPLEVIHRRSKMEDYARIAALCALHQVDVVVVGLPLNADDSAGPRARRVERYAAALQEFLQAQGVHAGLRLWDEHGSTLQAQEALRAAGRSSRNRRERLDAVAAAVILQDYLDARRAGYEVAL